MFRRLRKGSSRLAGTPYSYIGRELEKLKGGIACRNGFGNYTRLFHLKALCVSTYYQITCRGHIAYARKTPVWISGCIRAYAIRPYVGCIPYVLNGRTVGVRVNQQ